MAHSPLVLVVDDDLDSRNLLEFALTSSGYGVVTAINGREGLAAARQHHPRVILLDLAMPVMDGFTFRAEQLRDDSLAGIPVICVSGQHDAIPASTQLRVAACIPKPFDVDVIVEHVRQIAAGV